MLLSADFFAGQHGLKQYTSAWDIYTDGHRRNMQMYQLWHEDRTSSANSIESRVPFLDHRIVEHVMSIPRVHEKRLFWRKQILRDAMAKYLPVQLRERRKVGFFHGEDERFRLARS